MAAVEPMVLAAWTSTLVRALDAHGLDGCGLAREAGIDPAVLDDPAARVPLARSTVLWRLAVDATGDPCFGVEVSRHVRPGSFQALGVGVVASPTLAGALERIVQFGEVVLTGERRNAVRRDGDRYELVLGSLAGEQQFANEAMEAILASIVRVARFLVGARVHPVGVGLVRPVAPSSDRFERFFGCEVAYGCAEHVLAFDRALAERPLPAACDQAARAADRLAGEYLERVRTAGSFTAAVREAVLALLPSADPTPSAVGRALAVSARTLQRRLHEEGTTFRDVVCDARIDLAKELLATERLGWEALAHRVGFSEAAAFRRAFKRRTGMTPGAYVAAR